MTTLSLPQLPSLPPKLPKSRSPIPARHVSLPLPPPPKLPSASQEPPPSPAPAPNSPVTHLPPPRQRRRSLNGILILPFSVAHFAEHVAGVPPRQQKRRRLVAGVDQDELVDPAELADADSVFFNLNGVKIHHKISHHQEAEGARSDGSDENAKIGIPIVLLHGFGASVFSWGRAMKGLARVAGSKVLAFDRPAFGLTSREVERKEETGLNPYSMAFSVMVTISFIEMLGAGKAILMG